MRVTLESTIFYHIIELKANFFTVKMLTLAQAEQTFTKVQMEYYRIEWFIVYHFRSCNERFTIAAFSIEMSWKLYQNVWNTCW